MARNSRRSRGMKKLQPAVMKSWHSIELSVEEGNPGSDTVYFDTNQIKSLLNRRFYRQGLVDCLSSITIIAQPKASSTVFDSRGIRATYVMSRLPNTWVMSNAWEKAFRAWQKMNDEALEESASVKPRFLDFKIYADATHHQKGFAANSLPISHDGIFAPGEWEPSKFEIPTGSAGAQGATASRELLATGANYPGLGFSGLDAVSLISGYAASRGLPNVLDPNAPDRAEDVDGFNPDNWLAATFNEGTTQTEGVIEDMISENNIAPYPFENDGVNTDTQYPGGPNQGTGLEIHSYSRQTGTSLGATTRLPGGLFPCGLIRLDITNDAKNDGGFTPDMLYTVCLEWVPGTHRGYLATPMTEM